MNILALDVSSTNIGWCVESNNTLTSGTVKLVGPIEKRLCLAETAIDHLVQKFQPEAAAIEAPAYGSNTALSSSNKPDCSTMICSPYRKLRPSEHTSSPACAATA